MGKAGSSHCETRFVVQSFAPGSAKLFPVQKTDIEDIAKAIVLMFKRKPPPTLKGKMPSEQPYVLLPILVEGHVDKATDPQNYGTLDRERAEAVGNYLFEQIGIETASLPFRIQASYGPLGLGPDLPRFTDPRTKDSNPRKNRRAEVCIRGWEIRDPARFELNVFFSVKSGKIQKGDDSKIVDWYKALPAPLRGKIKAGQVHIGVWGRASTGDDSNDVKLSLSRAAAVKKILQQAVSGSSAKIFVHERGFGPVPTPNEKDDPKERSVQILVFDVIARIGRPWPYGQLSTLPPFS
jgi:outer membrane protein OmpA-like peptidoglycan-associated protein